MIGALSFAIAGFVLVALFIVTRLLRIGEHLLEDEIKARMPYEAMRLLKQAVAELPEHLCDLYRAEWAAELAALEGQRIRAVYFAYGCLRAARRETAELRPRMPAAPRRAPRRLFWGRVASLGPVARAFGRFYVRLTIISSPFAVGAGIGIAAGLPRIGTTIVAAVAALVAIVRIGPGSDDPMVALREFRERPR